MTAWPPNPFAEGLPAEPGWWFVGREAELARLRRAVRGGTQAVELRGPRGIGKTAFLRQLRAESDVCLVHLDVRDHVEPGNAANAVRAVSGLVTGILEEISFEHSLPVGTNTDSSFHVLRNEVIPAVARAAGRRVVIALDELDYLSPAARQKVRRTLIRGRAEDGPLWLLVVGKGWADTAPERLLLDQEPIALGPLERPAVAALLAEFPARGLFPFDEQAQTAVWEQTRGYPVFLAEMLGHLYELRGDRGDLTPIDLRDVEEAAKAFERQPAERLVHAVRQAGPAAVKVLHLLSEAGHEAMTTAAMVDTFEKQWPDWRPQLERTLEALRGSHLLDFHEGVWQSEVPLLRRYARVLDRADVQTTDRPPRPEAWAANRRGEEAERGGDLTGARTEYEDALQLDAMFWLPRWNLGRLLIASGRESANTTWTRAGRKLLGPLVDELPRDTWLAERVAETYCAATVELATVLLPGNEERRQLLADLDRNRSGKRPLDPELDTPGARDLRAEDIAAKWEAKLSHERSGWARSTREALFVQPVVGLDRTWMALLNTVARQLDKWEQDPARASGLITDVMPVLIDFMPSSVESEASRLLWDALERWLDSDGPLHRQDTSGGIGEPKPHAWEVLFLRSPLAVASRALRRLRSWFVEDVRRSLMQGNGDAAARLARIAVAPEIEAIGGKSNQDALREAIFETIDLVTRAVRADRALLHAATGPVGRALAELKTTEPVWVEECVRDCLIALAGRTARIELPEPAALAWQSLLPDQSAWFWSPPDKRDGFDDDSSQDLEGVRSLFSDRGYDIERKEPVHLPGFHSQLSAAVVEAYLAREITADKRSAEKVLIRRFWLYSPSTAVERFLKALWNQERRALSALSVVPDGRALLRYRDGFLVSHDSAVLVTEWVGHRTLRDLLESLPAGRSLRDEVGRVKFWAQAAMLIKAVGLLHRNRFLHRALCPDVVFVREAAHDLGSWRAEDAAVDPVFRLGHFEWSVYLRGLGGIGEVPLRTFGFYQAPEALRSALNSDAIPRGETYGSDLYSLGLTLFECVVRPLTRSEIRAVRSYGALAEAEHKQWLKNLRDELAAATKGGRLEKGEQQLIFKLLSFSLGERPSSLLGESLEGALRLAVEVLESSSLEPMILHTTLTSQIQDPRRDPNCIAFYLNRSLADVAVARAEELTPSRLARILERDLAGGRVFLNKSLGGFPLVVESRSGILFRIALLRRGYGTEKTIDPSRGWLELAQWYEGDGKEGLGLGKLQRCEVLDVAAEPDRGRPVGSWERWFAQARKAEGALKESAAAQARRRDLLDVLKLSVEAELEAAWKEVPYEKLTADGHFIRARDPSVNIVDEVAVFLAHDLLVELARPREPVGRGHSMPLLPEKLDRENKTIDLGEEASHVPHEGVIRPRDIEGSLAVYRRRTVVLRQLEDDTHLLDVVIAPAEQRAPLLVSTPPETFLAGLDADKQRITTSFHQGRLLAVQGPPGVGKTTLATEFLLQTLSRWQKGARVLVTTQSHAPLDNLVERLLEEREKNPRVRESLEGLELLRLMSGRRQEEEYPASVRTLLPYRRAEQLHRELTTWAQGMQTARGLTGRLAGALRQFMGPRASFALRRRLEQGANVVFVTTNAREIHEAVPASFDCVVVEEAARSFPVEVLGAMRLARQWLLIGDYEQLPPFGFERITDRVLQAYAERRMGAGTADGASAGASSGESSIDRYMYLFRHLHQTPPLEGRISHRDTLRTQWRMHPELADMVSDVFYSGEAVQNPSDPGELAALARRCTHSLLSPPYVRDRRIVWIDFDHAEREPICAEQRGRGGQLANDAERRTLVAFLRALDSKRASKDIAVLSPYRDQVEQLRGLLDETTKRQAFTAFGDRGIADCVHTVDSFQGRQAGLVVVSLVRNNRGRSWQESIGFLKVKQRSTVMFSRAEKLLVVLGCAAHFERFAETRWIVEIYERASKVKWSEIVPAAEIDKLTSRRRYEGQR